MEKWKEDLRTVFEDQKAAQRPDKKEDEVKSHLRKFFLGKVRPVLKKLKKELEKYDREVNVVVSETSGAIEVNHQGRLELDYKIKVRDIYPYPETLYQDVSGNRIWGEVSFREGAEKYSIYDLPEDVIFENFLREYKSRLWALSK